MSIDIYLIVGNSNAGKSTLVRSLAGKGQDVHTHPSLSNVLTLDWASHQSSPIQPKLTLVLHGSLNEGEIIPPGDLNNVLNDYKQQHHVERAILCLSTTVTNPAAAAYFPMRTFIASNHSIARVIALQDNVGNPPNQSFLPQTLVHANPFPFTPRNRVAAQARGRIGII